MTGNGNSHVCSVEHASALDLRIRRWVQNPLKILGPYIQEGMTVMDVGCGPGFFTVDMARLAGPSGRVIAADLQEGMLEKLRAKITGTELEKRVVLHKCGQDKIGVTENVDFVLLFYMVHEVPDKKGLFSELAGILKEGGKVLMVEPPMHVSRKDFEETVAIAESAGLRAAGRPKVFLSKAVVFGRI